MPTRWFSCQSRLVISFDPGKPGENGHAALQQLGIRFNKRFKFSTRLVLYRIPSWDHRIYLHEPGLYQQFRFPVYSGTGSKISIMASLKAGRRISLEAKGSVNREKEMKRWDAELQLRLDF
jgi:hypothetical protein